jgi:hypothetical protein
MRIKLKDLELALEYIKTNTISESVDIDWSPDHIGVNFTFTDKLKNVSAVKTFDANVNSTPEVSSVKKLYRNG